MTPLPSIHVALTIAGSDSGGGAGIQADLKTFAALGVHGMTAITAVTAQDSRRVFSSFELPPECVAAQIDAVTRDIGVHAVKTGMLSSPETVRVVAAKAREYQFDKLVVDPVMVSTGGDALIQEDAVECLLQELFPLAMVVTPNLVEAERLVGRAIESSSAMRWAAETILRWGPRAVIIKGGHFQNVHTSTDFLFDGGDFVELAGDLIKTPNTHGSGCTFASAITAFLAQGYELTDAAVRAKEYVTEAIRHSFPLGSGSGPLCHFYKFWRT